MTILVDPEQVSEQVLAAAGHKGPPADLEAVCSLWTSLDVHEEDLDQEGYLLSLGVLGAVILIRKDDPPTRKRFTLAHELGHWALANLEKGQVHYGNEHTRTLPLRTNHKRQTPEEIWCNKFAGCLLMPAAEVRAYCNTQELTNLPNTVLEGHAIFRVSQEAFMSRISELTPISIFEVVSTDGNVKVRRKFLSRSTVEGPVSRALEQLLFEYEKTNDVPNGPIISNNCEVAATLIRRSRYTKSWLVTVKSIGKHQPQ